jgi:hypothetical protein
MSTPYPPAVYRLLEAVGPPPGTCYNDIPADLHGDALTIAKDAGLVSEHINLYTAMAYGGAERFPYYRPAVNPVYRLTPKGEAALAWHRSEPPGPGVTQTQPAAGPGADMRRDGASWVVRWGEEHGVFAAKDFNALDVVAKLVAAPNRSVELKDLVDADTRALLERPESQDAVLDNPALVRLKQRYEELMQDKAKQQSERAPGMDASPELELAGCEINQEMADIAAQLKEAVGPGNRKRKLGRTPKDQAWDALTKGLRRLWPRLRKERMPTLADHLESNITIDQPCLTYHPPLGTPPWHVEANPA